MQNYTRAILFANGDCPGKLELQISEKDYLIAVDGGLLNMLKLGLQPHLLIGDLDSISAADLHQCQQAGVEILRFSPQKNETDLELALLEAIKREFPQILLTCALGGRLDHTLGNLSILGMPEAKGLQISILDGHTSVYLVRDQLQLATAQGDLISLIPSGTEVQGVLTSGLRYPLEDETLYPWKTRGLSNIALGERVSVYLKSGQLYVFHISTKTNTEEKEQDE